MRRLLKFIAFLVILAALGWALWLPGKQWVETRLGQELEARGFGSSTVVIDHIGLSGITLSRLSISEPPLSVENITIGYQWEELKQRQLDSVTLSNLKLALKMESKPGQQPEMRVALPIQEDINHIPVRRLVIEDSTLDITSGEWQGSIPFKLEADLKPEASINLSTSAFEMKNQQQTITVGPGSFQVTLKESWDGTFEINPISTGGKPDSPVITVKGMVKADAKAAKVDLDLTGSPYELKATGGFTYQMSNGQMFASLDSGQGKWEGGLIRIRPFSVDLQTKNPVVVEFDLVNVALDRLMKLLAEGKASANGMASGRLKIIYDPASQAIRIGGGGLKSLGQGTLSLSPEALPAGAAEQLDMVKALLQNFHYKQVDIRMDSKDKNELAAVLALEGNNPEVFEGKPVKLNVTLTGDVESFIRYSVMPMADPKSLLKEQSK